MIITAKSVFVIIFLLFYQITLSFAQGGLGSPAAGSNQSGIGVIAGWYCDAEKIEIVFDDRPAKQAAYGTSRKDTEAVCGDSDNGFGLTWGYGLIGEGQHRIRAYADGILFADRMFTVGMIGDGSYIREAEGSYVLKGFPNDNTEVGITWDQSTQNFTITDSGPIGEPVSLDGVYQLDRFSVQFWGSSIFDSQQPDISVSGSMTITGNQITQSISLTVDGDTFTDEITATYEDYGYFVVVENMGLESEVLLVERGLRLVTMFYDFYSWDEYVEVDYWTKIDAPVAANVFALQATSSESSTMKLLPAKQVGAMGARNISRLYDLKKE